MYLWCSTFICAAASSLQIIDKQPSSKLVTSCPTKHHIVKYGILKQPDFSFLMNPDSRSGMGISSSKNSRDHKPFEKPTTHYTKSGSINIAYQTFGSGPVDLVYIPGWVSNIDWMWECEELVDFFQQLSTAARIILFDKRGTGLSDRLVELSTLEERMDDIRAVMDAVDSQKAVLFGHSEGGCVSALFAATYPQRVVSLITFGIFAKRRYSSEYPWAPTDAERQEVYDMIEKKWGSGDMQLESLAPSMAEDKRFMSWLANYFRSGASPSAAMVLTKMNTEVDIINILDSINVPTMILQRTADIDVKMEEGRFIASKIRGSELVELDGADHLFWVGDTEIVLSKILSFISNQQPRKNEERQLLTLLAAKVEGDELSVQSLKNEAESLLSKLRGKLLKSDDSSLIATFEGPSKAVHAGLDLLDMTANQATKISIGIHITEVQSKEMLEMTGEALEFVNMVMQRPLASQIMITQTVKYLLSGAGLSFSELTEAFNTLSGDLLRLYSVIDPNHLDVFNQEDAAMTTIRNSFFETVLECINSNLNDETFQIDNLCKHVGVSERQLQRKLKTLTNKSPNQLISSVRLHKAKELLLSKDFNITEVAFKTGFSSPSYFTKKFKKEFGIPPSVVQKSA